jgi:hypothetical protein
LFLKSPHRGILLVHPIPQRTAPQQRSNSQDRRDARHREGQE